jgi:hypothetical protein
MSSYEELKSEIISEVLSEIDHTEVAQNIDVGDIAAEIDVSDVASYVEIDPADVNWEEIVSNVLLREYDVRYMVQDAMKVQTDDITTLVCRTNAQQQQIEDLLYDVAALRETVRILSQKRNAPWWKFWG